MEIVVIFDYKVNQKKLKVNQIFELGLRTMNGNKIEQLSDPRHS